MKDGTSGWWQSAAATIARGLLLATAVAALALALPRLIGWPPVTFVPSSFVTHSVMLGLSLIVSALLCGGRMASFGFTRGTFRLRASLLLWALPTACLATLAFLASGSSPPSNPVVPQTPLGVVLFVWIYASVCEEVLARGLLQSCLAPLAHLRFCLFRRWPLSVPVLLSALFFGAMHIVLWPTMGAQALAPMTLGLLLGLVAGYYREQTGSLLPAVLIHALANIGGTLPGWVLAWILHQRPA